MGKLTKATIMSDLTYTYKRIKSSANWSSIGEAQTEITTDVQSVYSNTEASVVNDWYMLGYVQTNVTLANTTCVDVTQTINDVLQSNTYYYLVNPDDDNNGRNKLQAVGYTFIDS